MGGRRVTRSHATPTIKNKSRQSEKLLWIVLVACLAVMPLGYLPLTIIQMPFLKSIHIALLFLLILTPIMWPGSFKAMQLLRMIALIYLLRLGVLVISLAWSPDPATGGMALFISFCNFGFAMAFCLMISRLSLSRLADLLAYGALAGAVAFHFSLFVGHALNGQSALNVLVQAALSGDLRQFKGLYFVGGLKGLGVEGVSSFFASVAPKATNSFGSAFVTPSIAAVHVVAADRILNKVRKPARDWAVALALVNAIFAVTIAFSDRVQVYAMLLVLTHIAYFGFFHGNRQLGAKVVFVGILSSISAMIYVLADAAAQGGFSEYVTRFVNNPRFTDLGRVFSKFGETGLLGGGFGVELGFGDVNYQFPHNLFLSDYLAAGMFGLAVAILWFGRLTYVAIGGFTRMINRRTSKAVRRIALSGLSILLYTLALTQLVSQGELDTADWLGLAIGLGVLAMAEELASKEATGQKRFSRSAASAAPRSRIARSGAYS